MNGRNIAIDSRSSLLVADVHADSKALEAILRKAKGYRYKCFLGDAVGYGPKPNETVQLIADFDIGIKGNHDSYVLGKNQEENNFSTDAQQSLGEHISQLDEQELDILEKLETSYSRSELILFHGTPKSENEYLMNEISIKALLRFTREKNIFIGGHMHLPRVAELDKKTDELRFFDINSPESSIHTLDTSRKRYLINIPSATPGRMGFDRPGYAILTPVEENHYRLLFDFV